MKTLHFLGDTVLDRPYQIDLDMDGFVFNLETPLSCEGTPARNKVNLCQDQVYILESFAQRPEAVSLANNHVMDFGQEAFMKTRSILESMEIPYFGAGLAGENFNNPYILEWGDKSIALYGYSTSTTHALFGDEHRHGSAKLDLDRVIADITYLKDRVDFTIVQPHWGVQEIPFPTFEDRQIAHTLIEAGVDMIVGHHAHVIQSHEVYLGKHIFYGLGNFIFPDLDIPTRHDGEKFTDRRIKKQEIEHRRSLVVTLDEALNVDFYTVLLEKGRVYRDAYKLPKWLPSSEAAYQKRLRKEQKRIRIRNFIRNPRIPTLDHLKRVLS